MKLEFLALKWGVTQKFREYLLGYRFIVYTDNNPLSHLKTADRGTAEHSWTAELAAFEFEVMYHSVTGMQTRCRSSLRLFVTSALTLPGTLVPANIYRGTPVNSLVAAEQSLVTPLPFHVAADLLSMQEDEPLLKEVPVFWH